MGLLFSFVPVGWASAPPASLVLLALDRTCPRGLVASVTRGRTRAPTPLISSPGRVRPPYRGSRRASLQLEIRRLHDRQPARRLGGDELPRLLRPGIEHR